ncbi:MAG: dihydropteroate synthase [Candidatus Nitrotoga sp.]|nr:dihydropteroate synthase [Candidatus Nitrotoga sp.]MBP0117276.1 dihydropteroate synthase [Candidatus Nitrotoga sp.]MBP0122964.1 dihydropteroate synthase [Candidatus Nitrotoga sp.]MBP0125567.1 dihydropteroate synthase [Candidatus Nitrotoga sp.]
MLFHCGSFKLDLSRALVMGIVNVTPDSFYDGGRYSQCDLALIHAHQLIQEGADIIDVGGESTRPGAIPVDTQVELDRIMPIIEGLRGAPVPISVDTYKPEVMRAVLAAGVSMINDVNSLQQLDAMTAVAESGAAVCLMHRNNLPKVTALPHYQNVVEEVMQFLHLRVLSAQKAGITKNRIMIDPGFGFDKTLTDNLTILKNIDKFTAFGVPVLAGTSRKSMLGEIVNQNVEHRVHASVAAALLAVMRGARMVRVHDVRATVDALRIFNATEGVGL